VARRLPVVMARVWESAPLASYTHPSSCLTILKVILFIYIGSNDLGYFRRGRVGALIGFASR